MNMIEVINGPLPDGVTISSHNVVGSGPVDYSLTLSIERADILDSMAVICDAQTLPVMTDEAACPVATGTLHFAADTLTCTVARSCVAAKTRCEKRPLQAIQLQNTGERWANS